jgi:hypothetical protein
VVHGPSRTVAPRPKDGSQPSVTAKAQISRRPIRNVGRLTPTSDSAWNSLAAPASGLTAAKAPVGTPEAEAQKRGAERQFQRRGKALLEQVRDRLAQPIRRAEVEARRLAEVAHGLRRNGIVQPERAPDRGALGWRRIGADHLTHRIAGGADDRKGDQADRHEDAGRLQDAGEEEGEHGMRYPPRYPVGRPKTRVL